MSSVSSSTAVQPVKGTSVVATPAVDPSTTDSSQLATVLEKIDANLDKITEKLTQEKVEKTTGSYWKYLAYGAGAAALTALAVYYNAGKVDDIIADSMNVREAAVKVAQQMPRVVNVTLNVVDTAVQVAKQAPAILETTLNVAETVSGATRALVDQAPSTLAIVEDGKNLASVGLRGLGIPIAGFRNAIHDMCGLLPAGVCKMDISEVKTANQEIALGGSFAINTALVGIFAKTASSLANFAFGWVFPIGNSPAEANFNPAKAALGLGYSFVVTALPDLSISSAVQAAAKVGSIIGNGAAKATSSFVHTVAESASAYFNRDLV